jgi:hypothetical protein
MGTKTLPLIPLMTPDLQGFGQTGRLFGNDTERRDRFVKTTGFLTLHCTNSVFIRREEIDYHFLSTRKRRTFTKKNLTTDDTDEDWRACVDSGVSLNRSGKCT